MRTDNRGPKWRDEFPNELIKHMISGNSFESFAGHVFKKFKIMVSRTALYNWCDKSHDQYHEDFAEAKELGVSLALGYYENLLKSKAVGVLPASLEKLKSRGIDITAVIFALKTRFHSVYGENKRIETEQAVNLVISQDEADL